MANRGTDCGGMDIKVGGGMIMVRSVVGSIDMECLVFDGRRDDKMRSRVQ